ncbi:hypothetical protein SARC_03688 [Sphaeroforma arctica JP610]|uniref:Uncharacterized protein n=1 Tax=Sphaeroforma arctica JP610 TaxID=667725 RepID=A0A0L0G502_9EUKA|nr:hypothetical protein SARC_03688 [Sphaeroforma arctica JP610]KNC84095.1 hypothetical protein SARC_03688 [Sphaeroforma arctica JP610]|eukprot:XP_014157997.1 hypothetical protein SARC_03688 [Sphaeroforma arctica JP610]
MAATSGDPEGRAATETVSSTPTGKDTASSDNVQSSTKKVQSTSKVYKELINVDAVSGSQYSCLMFYRGLTKIQKPKFAATKFKADDNDCNNDIRQGPEAMSNVVLGCSAHRVALVLKNAIGGSLVTATDKNREVFESNKKRLHKENVENQLNIFETLLDADKQEAMNDINPYPTCCTFVQPDQCS